jgi:uncharacterized protein (TIGR02996 family)
MQHEPNFYQAILDDPTNLDIRLIYADWLEDHYYLNQDYYDYSQLIRIQINNKQHKEQEQERKLLNKFKEEFHTLILEYYNGFIEYVYDNLSHPDVFRLLLNKYPIRGMRLILYEGFLKLYLEYTKQPRWKFIEELELNYYLRANDFEIHRKIMLWKKESDVLFGLSYCWKFSSEKIDSNGSTIEEIRIKGNWYWQSV